ncbi:hypothetical protein LBMAG22_09750 [Bacteroidota bacterium]|nr:hypothetical protein LBMAG22_09750 [Bacteroidota bacterium]
MSMKFLISLLLIVPLLASAQQKTTGIHQLNIPLFVRQGDQPSLGFQLFNTSKKDWTGTVHLQLIDSLQRHPVDGWFFNQQGNQYFTVEPNKKEWIEFPIHIPFEFSKPTVWELRIKTGADTLYKSGALRITPWEYAAEAATPDLDPASPVITKKIYRRFTKNEQVKLELLAENATVLTGDTLQVEIELTGSTSNKVILYEQWPAGTQPNMARSLSTHTGGGRVLQLTDKELKMEWVKTNQSQLKISYQLLATYSGRFQIPPVKFSTSDSTQPTIRSSYSSLIIEQRKHP